MSDEALRSNYNQVGLEIIELMYSPDYLSLGGTDSTDELASLAGLSQTSRVLDVGSGLGGPALHLATTYGCRVTGLDLIELNIQEASQRAQGRKLDHLVDFKLGTAMQMPFDKESFSVVWGQDAWCHVPDKERLIQECARVLEAGGTIAFTDWVQTSEMDNDYQQRVLSAAASPHLQTQSGYQALLEQQAFTCHHAEDISQDFVKQYRAIIDRLDEIKDQITGKFGPRVYQIVGEKNHAILEAFQDGKMGGCRFVAKKN